MTNVDLSCIGVLKRFICNSMRRVSDFVEDIRYPVRLYRTIRIHIEEMDLSVTYRPDVKRYILHVDILSTYTLSTKG